MFFSSPNSCGEIPTPNARVFGGGALGRCLGQEDGALRGLLGPPPHGRGEWKAVNQGAGSHQTSNLLVP